MARSHARLLCAIWRDEDWLELSPKAKLMYVTVLSQPRLSLVGTIDLAPGRWASLTGMSRDQTFDALEELEDAGFVLMDPSTDELLIPSFTRHDIDKNRVNVNLAKGLWGQWSSVASRLLRSVAVHEIPDEVWAKLEPHAPDDGIQNRRSARLERGDAAPVRDRETLPRFEPPPSSLLPPSHQPPTGNPGPVETEPAVTPEQRRQRIMEAARLVAQERADIRGDVGPGWVASTAQGIAKDHHQALHAHLAKNPTATALELVEEVIEARPTVVEVPTAVLPPPVADVLADQPPENFDGCREAVKHLRLLRSNPAADASQVVSSAAHVIPAKETL